MKNKFFALIGISLIISCSSTKDSSDAKTTEKVVPVSFQKDVFPILVDRCTPCHFPDKGRKKPLDTYEAVSQEIGDIIRRIELPHDNELFMPFKSKKEPLSDSLVLVFKNWRAQKMPK